MAYEDTPNEATNLGVSYFSKHSDGDGDGCTGVTASTQYLMIPRDVLDGITDTEMNETIGSYRALVRGMVDAFYNIENAKAASAKSDNMTVSRSGLSTVSGSTTEVQRTVSFTFTLDASALEVASETVT